MLIAGIDIGSNTILMQIVERQPDGNIKLISDSHGIARLGENLYSTGEIGEQAINKAILIIERYAKTCIIHNVNVVKAAATSAVREASNGKNVAKILENAFNNIIKNSNTSTTNTPSLKIDIISGEEEAKLSFKGALSEIPQSQTLATNTVIDIGGGSTEVITGNNSEIFSAISIPLGVVKITEKFSITQPLIDEKQQQIRDFIKKKLYVIEQNDHNGELIAVSGTPTALAKIALGINEYDNAKIQNYFFTQKSLKQTIGKVFRADINELVNNYNIEIGRYEVLSAGCLVISELLTILGKDHFIVSTNGLRRGLLL